MIYLLTTTTKHANWKKHPLHDKTLEWKWYLKSLIIEWWFQSRQIQKLGGLFFVLLLLFFFWGGVTTNFYFWIIITVSKYFYSDFVDMLKDTWHFFCFSTMAISTLTLKHVFVWNMFVLLYKWNTNLHRSKVKRLS